MNYCVPSALNISSTHTKKLVKRAHYALYERWTNKASAKIIHRLTRVLFYRIHPILRAMPLISAETLHQWTRVHPWHKFVRKTCFKNLKYDAWNATYTPAATYAQGKCLLSIKILRLAVWMCTWNHFYEYVRIRVLCLITQLGSLDNKIYLTTIISIIITMPNQWRP